MVAPWPQNPARDLEAAFRAIRSERMRGLPFVNDALGVEAVGFAEWGPHWLGILVTPWFMNLMLLPREVSAWQSVAPGDKVTYELPAGAYDFVSGFEKAIGEYQACSLFSPMFEFADHPSACATARAALDALFDAAHRDHAFAPPAAAAPSVSRRDFLGGRDSGRDAGR